MDEAMELKKNDRVFLIGGDIFGTVYFRSKYRPQAVYVVWDDGRIGTVHETMLQRVRVIGGKEVR
jgi:hypothetical protein